MYNTHFIAYFRVDSIILKYAGILTKQQWKEISYWFSCGLKEDCQLTLIVFLKLGKATKELKP